jgi:hypothetical protein
MLLSLRGRIALSVSVISLAAAAGAVGATVPAQAASPRKQAVTTRLNIPGGFLDGVAVTSASSAWAVGSAGGGSTRLPTRTLVLHWNGRTWAQVTDPRPVDGALQAVSAASADSVWAVGYSDNAKGEDVKSLIMRWNGKAWQRDTTAPQLPNASLEAVTATANGVWAVGSTDLYNPLIMHRVGGRWYVVPAEGAPHGQLQGVAVTGARTAWAIGNWLPGSLYVIHPFLLRWNGSVWRSVPFPLQSANGDLYGVAAGPSGTAWAVGHSLDEEFPGGPVFTPISMRFNGKTWQKVPVPVPAHGDLSSVAFVPGGTAWALGDTDTNTKNGGSEYSLSLRWTGTEWTPVKIPDDANDGLEAMAGTSPDNVWGVGASSSGSSWMPLVLHWNGRTWS